MNKLRPITIGTRKSKLAMTQTTYVADELKRHFPSLEITIKPIVTTGDVILDRPLSAIGSKGLFTEEIEREIKSGEIDMAVHSLKDMPSDLAPGLMIGAITARSARCDAFLSLSYRTLEDVPPHGVVGTSSLRRRSQLLALRPDLNICDLRGNVDTRLKKLDQGQYDGIVLAAAGLKRLKLDHRITTELSADTFIPASGQGALAIEIRCRDDYIQSLVDVLSDARTTIETTAERAFLSTLGGSCKIPAGATAMWEGKTLTLYAMLGSPDGTQCYRCHIEGTPDQATQIGRDAALSILGQGGTSIIHDILGKAEQS